jgi:hypothetical protein
MLKESPRPADGGWGAAGSISCLQVGQVLFLPCCSFIFFILLFPFFFKKNLQVGQVLFLASQTSAQDAWKSWLQGIRNTCAGVGLGFRLGCMSSAQDGSRLGLKV